MLANMRGSEADGASRLPSLPSMHRVAGHEFPNFHATNGNQPLGSDMNRTPAATRFAAHPDVGRTPYGRHQPGGLQRVAGGRNAVETPGSRFVVSAS